MAEIRCPRCGAINSEGLMDFPRCHRCHENLQRCLYCRHFAVERGECLHPTAQPLYVAEGERALRCPFFLSRYLLAPQPEGWTRPLSAVSWSLIVAGLILALVLGAVWLLEPAPYVPRSVFLTAEWSGPVVVGQSIRLSFFIYNRDPRAIPHPLLKVEQHLFRRLLWQGIFPQPLGVPYDREEFRFFPLEPIPPDTLRVVTLTLLPLEEGEFQVRAELWAEDRIPCAAHTLTVKVQPPKASSPSPP